MRFCVLRHVHAMAHLRLRPSSSFLPSKRTKHVIQTGFRKTMSTEKPLSDTALIFEQISKELGGFATKPIVNDWKREGNDCFWTDC